MKEQDNHPLDKFFKENTEQDFPYDPALWRKADKGIGAYFGKRYLYVFTAIALLFISSIAIFFSSDTASKAGEISMTNTSGNNYVSKENATNNQPDNTTAQTYTKGSDYEKASISPDENSSKTINDNSTGTSTPSNSESYKKTDGEINPDKDPSKNDNTINKDNEIESSTGPEIVENKANPIDESIERTIKMDDFNFVLASKSFNAFSFDLSTKGIESPLKNIDSKKRKFATTIEFEKLTSIFLTNNLSGLPQEELNYRNKYEQVKNSSSYSLNIMFQKAGFGLITGLGFSSASIKTNYITTKQSFELGETKFRMERDSIPYSGGYYTQIREFRDTTSRNTEVVRLTRQAPKNVLQWIQVPLKLSYQYPLYRIRFAARVGADFMWLYNTKGTFINPTLDGLNGEEKLNKFNITASGQLMAGYQLNHKIQVGGSYYINSQLRSNFSNYNSRFQSKGFGLYVRWSL